MTTTTTTVQRRAALVGLAALSAFYGAAVAAVATLLPTAVVTHAAWVGLYAACLVAALGLWHNDDAAAGAVRPRRWLAAAGLAVLIACIFSGANFALDALKGQHRAKADVAQQLGGLELWWVLCPGAASVALASAIRAALLPSARR